MEGESGFTQNIFDDLDSSDIQRYQMEDGSDIARSIIDELHSSDMQRDQKEGESGVTPSIIDDLQYMDMIKWKVKLVIPEVSMMKLILVISN